MLLGELSLAARRPQRTGRTYGDHSSLSCAEVDMGPDPEQNQTSTQTIRERKERRPWEGLGPLRFPRSQGQPTLPHGTKRELRMHPMGISGAPDPSCDLASRGLIFKPLHAYDYMEVPSTDMDPGQAV